MPPFRRLAIALPILLLAAACTEEKPVPGPPQDSRTVEEMARAVGSDVLGALHRGYFPETSTDIAFVPEPYNVVVRWSGVGLGTGDADPSTTHPTPWDYHQRVPILFNGGSYRGDGGGNTTDRVADVTGIPSTFAELLGMEGFGQGTTLRLGPPPTERERPRAIVLVAYDGGGWNLLEQWPSAWPELHQLMTEGTLYTNATIGSAPAVTSAIHANMGAGTYPSSHGVAEITARLPDGSVGDVFFDKETDPRLLLDPTLADEWDLRVDNRAWIGMIGYESWHLGMMSHGAQWPGGDRDVAVLWEQEPGIGEFFTNEELYELPDYLPGEEELQARLDVQDSEDGALDGMWNGYDLQDPKVVPATPAFVEHQGEALLEMMKREPFGDDDVTDLLFVELKPTDFGGHLWNMVAPEEEQVLRAQDTVLGEIVDTLNSEVGEGEWVLALTADHGQTPLPETTGGLRIHPDILGADIDGYFGRKIVQKVTPSGIFLHNDAMEAAGITVEEVARFVGDYRYGDGLPQDADRSKIPQDELDRLAFAGAFPGEYLGGLTDAEIDAAGSGDYPEGDLSSPADVPFP
ncbi:MAG: alkaline phosphatase family protein [Actinomycetota bacterium]